MKKTTALCIVSTYTKRHNDDHQTTVIFRRFPPLLKQLFRRIFELTMTYFAFISPRLIANFTG